MTTIGIIGVAHGQTLNLDVWNRMCQTAEHYITSKIDSDWSHIHLVSGGAAWSDHVAVYLYMQHPEAKLTLHLPCRWDHIHQQFVDNGGSHWAHNPGRLANKYHHMFTQMVGFNSLQQLETVMTQGASIVDHYKGFHARNRVVGDVQCLLAFSYAPGDKPVTGGTLYTWKHSNASVKQHYPIKIDI